MVFSNIFGSAGRGAGLFSVSTGGDRPRPGEGIDFEDAEDDTYDDRSTSLFADSLHGASPRSKIVQEQSSEARVIMGFLGSFVQSTQASADAQSAYAQNPGSVSSAAAAGMNESSTTVTENSDFQKSDDLTMPSKSDYTSAPQPPKPSAEEPSSS